MKKVNLDEEFEKWKEENGERLQEKLEVKMGVYNKDTNELEDFGYYSSVKEAKEDFYNWDKQRNRKAIIESEEGVEELK